MFALLEFFNFLKHRHHDHDGVDNLNTRFVCIYAIAVGFLLFASEYGVNSIQCFDKANWRSSWKQYTDDYCFIEGTYFVDPTKKLPLDFELPNSVKVDFYQWTPFIFLFIALLFHTPRIFWAAVNSTSYLYFQELCESSIEYRDQPHKECVRRFDVVSTSHPPRMPSHFGIGNLNKYYEEKIGDKYLIISYFVVKAWHIVNVILATLLLCLLTPSHLDDYFGIHTIWNLVTGVNWKKSGAFPRITTCEIGIRQYNFGRHDRIKNEQSQCFLAANNYIEKLFIVTWFIFAFLFVRNVVSLFEWIRKIYYSESYIFQLIRARSSKNPFTENETEKKALEYEDKKIKEYTKLLLFDARFAILMVASQSRDFVGANDLMNNYINWRKGNDKA